MFQKEAVGSSSPESMSNPTGVLKSKLMWVCIVVNE